MLTVCVVTFNAEKLIKKTLENLLANTAVTRIIVKDGCSIDRTHEIVRTFTDKRVELVVVKDDGIYDAMNQAMQKVNHGSYFVFINADDTLINENFNQIDLSKNDVVISPVQLFQGQKFVRIFKPDVTQPHKLNVHHQGFFCRKSPDLPIFNPSLGLLADLAWMREVIDFFGYQNVYLSESPLSSATLGGISDTDLRGRIKSRFLYHSYFGSNALYDADLYKEFLKLILGRRIKLIVRSLIN